MVIRVHRGGKAGSPSLFSGPSLVFGNVWKHSTLTRHMIKKDVKLAYHGTLLGYVWTLLEPLLMTIILYALFVILRGSSDEYMPLKVMLGLLFYSCFSKTMSMCTNAMIQNSSLINQVYFPRELFHVSISGYQLYRLVMSLLIIIPLLIWYQLMPTIYLLLLIPATVGISMLAIGMGMIASVIQVRVRDVSQLVVVLLRAGFFISGVFYGAEHVPAKWLHLHLLNPVAVFIEVSRVSVLGDMGVLQVSNILYAMGISLFFMLLGMGVFKRYESRVVKYL